MKINSNLRVGLAASLGTQAFFGIVCAFNSGSAGFLDGACRGAQMGGIGVFVVGGFAGAAALFRKAADENARRSKKAVLAVAAGLLVGSTPVVAANIYTQMTNPPEPAYEPVAPMPYHFVLPIKWQGGMQSRGPALLILST